MPVVSNPCWCRLSVIRHITHSSRRLPGNRSGSRNRGSDFEFDSSDRSHEPHVQGFLLNHSHEDRRLGGFGLRGEISLSHRNGRHGENGPRCGRLLRQNNEGRSTTVVVVAGTFTVLWVPKLRSQPYVFPTSRVATGDCDEVSAGPSS